MNRPRTTFVWMAVLSIGTLLLGTLRELVVAHGLQASDRADLFFRGVVVVGAARSFTLALLRARWIPLPCGVDAVSLLRTAVPSCTFVAAAGVATLAVMFQTASWHQTETITFAACVVVATYGAALRTLAERHGRERLSIVLDWIPILGTIGGLSWAAETKSSLAVGATAGLTIGMLVTNALLWPAAYRRGDGSPLPISRAPGWALYVDTLIYVNLGLVDSWLSIYVLQAGDLALLSYAYMFVNAILAVPTAGATVLALRQGTTPASHEGAQLLLRWALRGGAIAAAGVLTIALILTVPYFAGGIDELVGWSIAGEIDTLVLASVPFAALRMANTVGRQRRIAQDPGGVVKWDMVGLFARTAALACGAVWFGPVASPLALALSEAIQVGAWLRWGNVSAPQPR